MNINVLNRVIVSEGPSEVCDVHAPHVHHHEFPENWAQGETVVEATWNLIHQFERCLDNASPDRRMAVESALADVQTFLEELQTSDKVNTPT